MTNARARFATIALLVLIVLVAVPASAAAQSAWRGISVTLHDIEPGKTPTLVVFGSLAEGATLPATVELPIPKSCEIGWVGEVFPDPSRDAIAPFELRSEGDYDVLVVTLTRSVALQAELVPPAGWIAIDGESIDIDMAWFSHDALPGMRIGFEVPEGLHAEVTEPAATPMRTSAGVLYAVETTQVAASQPFALRARVVDGPDPILTQAAGDAAPAGTIPQGAPAASRHATTPIVISVLALAVGVLVVTLVFTLRRRALEAEGEESL